MINRLEDALRAVGRGFIPGTVPFKSTWALAPAQSISCARRCLVSGHDSNPVQVAEKHHLDIDVRRGTTSVVPNISSEKRVGALAPEGSILRTRRCFVTGHDFNPVQAAEKNLLDVDVRRGTTSVVPNISSEKRVGALAPVGFILGIQKNLPANAAGESR